MFKCEYCREALPIQTKKDIEKNKNWADHDKNNSSLDDLVPSRPDIKDANTDREDSTSGIKSSEPETQGKGSNDKDTESDIKEKASILPRAIESDSDDSDETESKGQDTEPETEVGYKYPYRRRRMSPIFSME
jgi:hypothetical protein